MNQVINSKQLKSYLKKVKATLQLTHSKKEIIIIMQNFQNSVSLYFEENPLATFEDFKSHFGEPENISIDIFDETLTKHVDTVIFKKHFFQILIASVIALSILLGCLFCISYIKEQNATIYEHKIEIDYHD